MRRSLRALACCVWLGLLGVACTDESEGGADATIPTQEEALLQAREDIDSSNADQAFAELQEEIESDRAALDE